MPGVKQITTYQNGYTLQPTYSGVYVYATGSIGGEGLKTQSSASVTNQGTIAPFRISAAQVFVSYGILLAAGGSVKNGAGGVIEGSDGIFLDAFGAVTNYGRILVDPTPLNYGVQLDAGGSVTNGGALGPALIEGGILAKYGATTVRNFGSIAGPVNLLDGGSVQNGGAGYANASMGGVYVAAGATADVANYASISGGVRASASGLARITNGASVDTTARIVGPSGVTVAGIATIANWGSIVGGGFGQAFGVYAKGGAVTNGGGADHGALISGEVGVQFGGAGAIANYGTIEGFGATIAGAGASLAAGSLINGGGGDTTALIEGNYGVWVHTGAGAVSNFATILATGGPKSPAVFLQSGGYAVNGSVNDTGALISGGGGVVVYASVGSVSNFGTILSTAGVVSTFGGQGIMLGAGGGVTNGSGTDRVALIQGYESGVAVKGAAGAVVNFGVIRGTGGTGQFGVDLQAGGSVANGSATDRAALIEGYSGLDLQGASATNFGTIIAQGDAATQGANLGPGASLTNRAGAVISGYAGVIVQGAGTVTNFGSIVGMGGVAVHFASAVDTLIVGAGSTFVGAVHGGGGTLVLASGTGVLAGLFSGPGVTVSGSMTTTTFQGFNAVRISAGATFAMAGAVSVAAGQTLTNSGSLILTGNLAVNGLFIAQSGRLTLGGKVTGAGFGRIGAGTLDAAASATFNTNVTFTASSTGELELAHGATYAGTISGFSKAGTTFLDLGDIAYSAAATKATFAGTAAGGTLTVTDGAHTAKIKFTGDYRASAWVLGSDGHGGTLIHDPAKAPVASAPTQIFVQAMAGVGAAPGAVTSHLATVLRQDEGWLAAPRAVRA